MNEENILNILLSREELMLVLNVLEAPILPGIDADPVGEIDDSHARAMLTAAQRGLRARGLARLDENGAFTLHNDLLENVGACAFADNALLVYHWGGKGTPPDRLFGHVRDGVMVTHTRPDPVLHLISRMPSREVFVDEVLAACLQNEQTATAARGFTLNNSQLRKARELAEGDGRETAKAALVSVGVAEDSADSFAKTLASQPIATIFQAVSAENGTVSRRDFTLLQDETNVWLLGMTDNDNEFSIQATSRDALQKLMIEWL